MRGWGGLFEGVTKLSVMAFLSAQRGLGRVLIVGRCQWSGKTNFRELGEWLGWRAGGGEDFGGLRG
jgi:hypothetical protein